MSFDYEAHRKKQREELDKKRNEAAAKKKRERREKEQKQKNQKKWDDRKKQMREETEKAASEMNGAGPMGGITSDLQGMPQQSQPAEAPRINRGFGMGSSSANHAAKKAMPGNQKPGQKPHAKSGSFGGQGSSGQQTNSAASIPKLRRPF